MPAMIKKIKDRIENGYTIDSISLYKDTFDTFKRMFLPATLVMFLVSAVIFFMYLMVILIYFKTPQQALEKMEGFSLEQLENDELAVYFIINALLNALFSVVGAGFISLAKKVSENKLPTIGTVFQYFIKISGLKVFFFVFMVQILFSILSLYLQINSLDLVALFCLFLMHALTILVVPLIVFDQLSILQALTTSVRLVNQQPLKIFLFLFFMGSFALGGLFFFLVGILATFPLLYAFIYHLYSHIIDKE